MGERVVDDLLGATGPSCRSVRCVPAHVSGTLPSTQRIEGHVPDTCAGIGHPGHGPVVYWMTDDLEAKVAEVEAAGGTVVRPVTAVGGGTSLALLTDPAGNQVGFITQG